MYLFIELIYFVKLFTLDYYVNNLHVRLNSYNIHFKIK